MSIKYAFILISTALVLLFSGCGEIKSAATMGASEGRGMGSLTFNEDQSLKDILKNQNFSTIVMDLDKFLNGEESTPNAYEIDMAFSTSRVEVVADCQIVQAKYKVSGDELSFSKVSIRPATELPTCKESERADDAVYNFFQNSYTLKSINNASITLHSDDVDSDVTLVTK